MIVPSDYLDYAFCSGYNRFTPPTDRITKNPGRGYFLSFLTLSTLVHLDQEFARKEHLFPSRSRSFKPPAATGQPPPGWTGAAPA